MSIWRGGEVRRRRGPATRWSSMMEVFCRKRSSLVVADYLCADRLWERRGGGRGGPAWSSRSGWGTLCATRWEMLRWKWQAYLKFRLAGIQFQAKSAPQLPLRGEWKWKVCSKTDYSIVSETQVNNFWGAVCNRIWPGRFSKDCQQRNHQQGVYKVALWQVPSRIIVNCEGLARPAQWWRSGSTTLVTDHIGRVIA